MSWDTTWETVFQSQQWGKYPGEDLIRFVARNFYQVEDRSTIKILELGCGPGANIWFMAREGFSVYAIEGSQTAVDLTLQRLNQEVTHWTGEIRTGDFNALPYENDFFDAVIDIEAITHNPFENAKGIYEEARRVLKPGGKLYSRTFAKGTIGDETGEQLSHNCYLPDVGPMSGKGQTRFTSEQDITELLKHFRSYDYEYQQSGKGNTLFTKEWLITATK